MLAVRFFGQYDVCQNGQSVVIPGRAAQALFAFLILHAHTLHSREFLAGLIWTDCTEEHARHNLRQAIWQLRRALDTEPNTEWILADELQIHFNVQNAYWFDVAELERESKPTVESLSAAVALYAGNLLPGLYHDWVIRERERLMMRYEAKMNQLLDLLMAQGAWEQVIVRAEEWIAQGAVPEPAYRALMRAQNALGNMAQVAFAYEHCAAALDAFGIKPSRQTRDLYCDLLRLN